MNRIKENEEKRGSIREISIYIFSYNIFSSEWKWPLLKKKKVILRWVRLNCKELGFVFFARLSLPRVTLFRFHVLSLSKTGLYFWSDHTAISLPPSLAFSIFSLFLSLFSLSYAGKGNVMRASFSISLVLSIFPPFLSLFSLSYANRCWQGKCHAGQGSNMTPRLALPCLA